MSRLDVRLSASLGSRTKAQDAIKVGRVQVNGKTITKVAYETADTDTIVVAPAEHDYVSRAGGKLAALLDEMQVDLSGQVVLDIGASTGGFTQVSLEHGARKVYALDVGHLQLSPLLEQDSRVVKMEGVNGREIQPAWFDEPVDFVSMDVSFISALSILEPLLKRMPPRHLAVLVKPQFECGKAALNKSGVVKKEKDRLAALEKVKAWLRQHYSRVRSIPSPVVGRSGNQEYMVYASGLKEPAPGKE